MAKREGAVFLDRDGVLNKNIFNPATQEYESPHTVADLQIEPHIFSPLKELQKNFKLFVVSNQPSYAKGKVSLETLESIENHFEREMSENKISISKYFYCHHHPEGIVPEFTMTCPCRKPNPYFLLEAAKEFNLDLHKSWMVGDRDTDIKCGKAAGCRTILILTEESKKYQEKKILRRKLQT